MNALIPRLFLLLACLISTVLVAALYWGAVRTEPGQRLDHRLNEARKVEPLAIREDATALLNTIGSVTLPILTGAVVLLALSVGGWRRALGVGALMTGAVLSAELLKALLIRPGLIDIERHLMTRNSFPSGHATIAMSIGLALIMAAPARLRWLVAFIAVLLAAAFGVATSVGGWHRPSDILAGYLIALAWSCLVGWLLLAAGEEPGEDLAPASRSLAAAHLFHWSAAMLLLSWLLLVVLMLLDFELGIGEARLMMHDELLVAAAVLISSALYIVWWWVRRHSGPKAG